MRPDSRRTVVSAAGLGKAWPGGGGLRPLTFSLAAGRLVVVRGRSGSGKSTLLSILAGWCVADTGSLEFADDLDAERWSSVALVPQTIALSPELTISENIELPLRLGAACAPVERRRRVDRLLERLDLTHERDRPPRETSMGQQQRAAIARALVADPVIVLIDEPTSHQDGRHADSVVDALRSAADDGIALLVATHDPAVAGAASSTIDLDD